MAAVKEQSLSTRERGRMRRSVHFQFKKNSIYHSEALERNAETDRGAFNPTQCCVPATSGWHSSGSTMNGNLRTLMSDHTLCFFSEETSQKECSAYFIFSVFIVKNLKEQRPVGSIC